MSGDIQRGGGAISVGNNQVFINREGFEYYSFKITSTQQQGLWIELAVNENDHNDPWCQSNEMTSNDNENLLTFTGS